MLRPAKYIWLLLLLIHGGGLFSQEISFTHLTMNDGLSTNFVNTVCQDKTGFIWIGTENGLQRYDGNKFVYINSANTNKGLPGLPVDEIIFDTGRNTLWLRMGMVVGKFDPVTGEFDKATLNVKNMPNTLVPVFLKKDSHGHIILVISYAGAFVYNDQNNSFEENKEVIATPPDFTLFNIYEDAKHSWFYLCGREGLRIFDASNGKFYDSNYNPYQLPEMEATSALKFVQYAYIDGKNRFWINTLPARNKQQLFLLDRATKKLIPKNIEPTTDNYTENFALAENHGQLFCYGTNVLNMYDDETGKLKKFYDSTSLNFAAVKKLYSDRDDNLWIISDNGLYEAIVFGKYKHQGKLPGAEQFPVTSFTQLDSKKYCRLPGALA